jgi:23S rRNA (guanosine2251-2'-O)-methyltransferase
MKNKMIFGFHAVTSRLRHEASRWKKFSSTPAQRRPHEGPDRQRQGGRRARHAGRGGRLDKIVGTRRHQGVIAFASQLALARNLDELLDAIEGPPLLLILDGITDPHNLGACLRVADGVGAHAVIVPKDRAVGLNATAAKVASGAAETVPYITVTNLARTMRELKDRGIWLIGTSDDAEKGLYEADFTGPTALVMGSEGEGMRRLTRETCDLLVSHPDVRLGRKPERVGRVGRLPVRSAPPARYFGLIRAKPLAWFQLSLNACPAKTPRTRFSQPTAFKLRLNIHMRALRGMRAPK